MKIDKYLQKYKTKLTFKEKQNKNKKVVWCLFDSGTGSYSNYLKDDDFFEYYALGTTSLNEKLPENCINILFNPIPLLFDDFSLLEKLSQLPKPDVIIASPPCESWSMASAIKGGNSSWKHVKESDFIIRGVEDYEDEKVQYKFTRSYLQRINGELTAYVVALLITLCEPKIYIVENPYKSKIFEYFEKILQIHFNFDNLTYYHLYGFDIQKATNFKSNIDLKLLNNKNAIKEKIKFKHYSKDYNVRSKIPYDLIKEIFKQVKLELQEK